MPRIDPKNTTRYWTHPRVAGLSCLHADFTTHAYSPHSHDGFVVAVTELGGAEFKSRGRTDQATTSVLLVFNPEEPHSGHMGGSPRWCYRSLYLAPQAIALVAHSLGIAKPIYFTRNVLYDPELIRNFRNLHEALDAGRDTLEQHELLITRFGALSRRYGEERARIPRPPRNCRALRQVIEHMRDCYAENLTLELLSSGVGLTPFQLIGLFKRSVGLTPHAYLTQVRLHAAMQELRAGASPTQAALAAGFFDQSALNKQFKRSLGITPLQYTRAL